MAAIRPLHVLILEDNPVDADLLGDALAQAGIEFDYVRVENATDFAAQLSESLDLILADYSLPQFNALQALQLLQDQGTDIPFIVVTGSISEETAAACIKQGAADYLLKDRLTRLGQAVVKALADKDLREERRNADKELKRLKEFNENIVQTMTEGVVILDANGVVTFANAAAAAFLGYTAEESVGLALLNIKSFVAADQHAIFDTAVENRKQGEISRYEVDISSKDGARRSVLISSGPRFEDGHFAGTLVVLTDITERKQAEQVAREREARLASIYNTVADVIFHLAVEAEERYRFVSVNPAFISTTGLEYDQVVGKRVDEIIPEPSLTLVMEKYGEAIRGKKTVRWEETSDYPTGRLIGEVNVAPVFDDAGHCTHLVGAVHDITERRRAEQKTVELAAIVQSSHDGIFGKDLEGIITSWNKGAENAFGYSESEVIGKSVSILVPTERAEEVPEILEKIRLGKGIESYETVRRTKSGQVILVSLTVSPVLDTSGRIVGASTIARDITERKRGEELLVAERNLLRTLIDNLPDRIYAKDTEGRFILINQVQARLLGAVSADEVIGKTVFDYHPVELAEQYYADDQTVIHSDQSLMNQEEQVIAADATRGWALTSKVPLRDAQGNVIGLVGISRDITERKEAERRLRRLNRTLTLLSNVNQTIVRIRLISALFEQICRIAVEDGGFRMAWVGLLDLETNRVRPVAHAGVADGYLEKLAVLLSDEPYGSGPTANTLRMGKHVIISDIEDDPRVAPLREDALKLGYRTMANFPLYVAGEARGTFGLYASAPGFFDDEELKLLDEMAADISFAMEYAEQEAQRQQAETALKYHVQAVEEMRLFLQTTLDAFPANTVVLDTDGTIINVNVPWVRFADANGAPSPMHYLGKNYLTVCDTAAGLWSEEAAPAGAGIRAVIDGLQDEFYLEYPCHSQSEKRWFAMQATPFPEPAPRRVVVAHLNITERKKAEERLQEAHDLLEQRVIERTAELQAAKQRVEAILNSNTDGIVLVYSDLRLQQTNPSFNRLFACEPEDYFDKSLFSLVRPEDADLVTETIQASRDGGERKPLEVRAQRKDGTVFDAEFSFGHVKGDGLVFTIRDITERKQRERQLRYYASLQENVSDAVISADLEFRIQSWNQAAERIYGWRAEEATGKIIAELLQTKYGSDEEHERIIQAFLTQGHWEREFTQRRKDGAEVHILGSTNLLKDERGVPFGIVALNHDITERKRAEEMLVEQRNFLQLVIDSVPDLVIVKDRAGRFQLVNALAAQLYSTTPADLVGKTDEEVNPNQHEVTFIQQKDREAFATGQTVNIIEEAVLDRYYQTSKIPLRNHDGQYDRLLVVSSDVTQYKIAEAALRQAVEKEKELGDLKSRFVSMASHEFRTPLATILATTDTLSAYRHKLTEDQIEQRLTKIKGQVGHLRDIMDDVLFLARMQARRVEFNPVMLDLDALCRSILEEFQSRPDIQHQFVYSCDGLVRDTRLDHKLMRQIINNLISNAIKYSLPDKPVRIHLEFTSEAVVLSVSDQGIGIPESDQKHLFEPFHRGDNVGSISGTGLGLVITKESVEMHGGTITVVSQVGAGTTFTVTTPVTAEGGNSNDKNPGN